MYENELLLSVVEIDLESTKKYIELGADVNAFNGDIVGLAFGTGLPDLVELIMNNGASNFTKAFIYCAENNRIAFIELLIEYGIDPVNNGGNVAFRIAALHGYNDIIRIFLSFDILDDEAVDWAAEAGNYDTVQLLLDNGMNFVNANGVFTLASAYGYDNIVLLLLDKGVDIHFDNDKALSEAVHNNRMSTIKLLVQKGADILGAYAILDIYNLGRMNDTTDILKFLFDSVYTKGATAFDIVTKKVNACMFYTYLNLVTTPNIDFIEFAIEMYFEYKLFKDNMKCVEQIYKNLGRLINSDVFNITNVGILARWTIKYPQIKELFTDLLDELDAEYIKYYNELFKPETGREYLQALQDYMQSLEEARRNPIII
jgi:hypothetical protein